MSEDKKIEIEIEVPVGYKLVQDGMNIKFVKIDERFLSWEEKDSKLISPFYLLNKVFCQLYFFDIY
jgi:hypothetical protein